MKTDQYGQIIYNESDLVSMIMRDATIESLSGMLVEPDVNLETASAYLEQMPELIEYAFTDMTVAEFDEIKQNSWHMPAEYQHMDIAEYILSLCDSEANYNVVAKNCCCSKNATCLTCCAISNILLTHYEPTV